MADFSEQLTQTDKNRFYRVHSWDNSTIVAVSKITLEPSGNCKRPFVARTDDGKHAELYLIEQVSDWLKDRDLTGQTVKLTTMATYSPCSDCMFKLKDMLKKMKQKYNVQYKLRIGHLNHGKKTTTDVIVKQELTDWKQEIEKLGVQFTLEAISVCNELPGHTPRQVKCDPCNHEGSHPESSDKEHSKQTCSECKRLTEEIIPNRKEKDDDIAKHVKYVNTQPTLFKWFSKALINPTHSTSDEMNCTATTSSSAQEQSYHHLCSPPSNSSNSKSSSSTE